VAAEKGKLVVEAPVVDDKGRADKTVVGVVEAPEGRLLLLLLLFNSEPVVLAVRGKEAAGAGPFFRSMP
jgi:hypothetical protein